MDSVHEGYISHSDKEVGTIKNTIWQFPFKNTEEVMHKANRYSSLGVSKLHKAWFPRWRARICYCIWKL